MARIATYVFLDLETTGIPCEENNRTKITELSMVAVKRNHVLDTRPGALPRVQHKLTLCFNPWRLIQPSCTEVTGLSNDLLEHEMDFNMDAYTMINTFLNALAKPVCLIAQNGLHFDYPILKNHLEKLQVSFSGDLLCADCYHAFYDIMEAQKKACLNLPVIQDSKEVDTSTGTDEVDLFTATNTLAMKVANETTPKEHIKPQNSTPRKDNNNRISKAKRRFPWSSGAKPIEKYKLKDIYERLLNRPAIEAHRAENDCILALECSVALSKEFVDWVDVNSVLFSEIKPMTIGVRLGD